MDVEIQSFLKVWIIAISCSIYCYYIVSKIPNGLKTRLPFILPIIIIFIIISFDLSSFHLGGSTIFYLVWLANFKLLLFAFNKGPLSFDSNSSGPNKTRDILTECNKEHHKNKRLHISLLHFIFIALLPIKSKQETQTPKNKESPKSRTKSFLLALKTIILAIIIYIYQFRSFLHPYFILALYCCHLYLGVELFLFITSIPVQFIGLEIEPQFNEPYLSTSLQDFWGRRWNLMVTSILRPTVYYPIRNYIYTLPPWAHWWGTTLAMLSTFVVSGLMHEVIYYYLTRVAPTWEVTWFFVLHGVCTVVEVAVKKVVDGKWRLHTAVSRLLTVVFVAVSGVWLFLPQVIRNGVELNGQSSNLQSYDMIIPNNF